VSIGLGQYRFAEEMEAFVHRVDQLIYRAKREGKHRLRRESTSPVEKTERLGRCRLGYPGGVPPDG